MLTTLYLILGLQTTAWSILFESGRCLSLCTSSSNQAINDLESMSYTRPLSSCPLRW